MDKNKQIDFFFLLFILIIGSYSKDLIEFEFGQIRRGSLARNEYDYYFLTLPKELEKDSYLIIELEPTKYYDYLCNIVSDPNLYVSMTEKMPSKDSNTWKSERFGDETISISPSFLSPQQNIYISVHCNEKCNYMLKVQFVKDIPIQENGSFNFILNPKTVTKFSFTTRSNFDELNLNIISSNISSFNAYLAKENPSSSNTLPATPIIFNGYRFTINNQDTPNTNTKYHLIIDNDDDRQDLTIWLQYDNEKILIKETNILYDSISENKAHCYYYPIDYFNENKEIIISTTLFNGQGFIYMAGYNPINADSIKLSDKNKNTNYIVIQNRVIRLTKDNLKNFGTFEGNQQNFLNFCFYAERSTSLSINAYFYENYKRLQDLNIVYAGIGIEDILRKRSVKQYKLEHFNIDQDITFFLEIKYGNPKLYLFMAKPGEENLILNNNDFEKYKRNNQILEAKQIHNKYNLYLTKELNKCKPNEKTGLYPCYLRAIIECQGEEDCTYSFSFDHSKDPINMEQKITYSNVISENEYDYYKIIISDASVKNLVIVLMQNTGKTLLRLDSFTSESDELKLNEEAQNNQFLPNLIKISSEKLKTDNLKGIFNLKVKGLSYASYSLYYYSFNIEENTDQLDYDKVSMKLEKGKIIKDIFMDTHRFKVYMYDSSTIGNKTNLFIGLVETNYINLELYVFKDLNDFSIYDEKISGYLWKGDTKDYIYINKYDKKYIENNILYIMIFKKQSYRKEDQIEDTYTPFYLGITDERTPLLLDDGVEFKYQLNTEHPYQRFYYYFVDNGEKDQELQISISLYYGHVIMFFEIEDNLYSGKYVFDESDLITIKREDILPYCKTKKECGIQIEVENDDTFLQYSSFLISVRNSKNTPVYLKQGNTNKRTILTGEDQYYVIDIKPDKSFGAKISVMFTNGQGEIYARRLLRNEIFQNNIFPDDINYEYMAGYKNMDNGIYLIQIPYRDFEGHSYCQVLLTVRGISPGHFYTKIEYTISVSNFLHEILTEKNYKLFISQGEISNFHFKVGPNKKRLYVSMTNKDKDANMFLTSDTLMPDIYQYEWRSSGGYNEYIDISVTDPYFVERGINDVDGDYYLVIHGIEDTFYNLYISSQDVKIVTIMEGVPGVCSCETENDNCYFRYENLDKTFSKVIFDRKMIFYTEYTYGSGSMSAKLYKNGNMDEILKDLPSKNNHDAFTDDSNEYLFMEIKKEDPRYTYNSVVVVGVQCKQKSLFDLTVTLLDSSTDVSRNTQNLIYLKLNKDNIFYLSSVMGINSKFVYYIFKNENLNFKIKTLLGKAQIHTYTNKSAIYSSYLDEEVNINNGYLKNYKHISDFTIDKNTKDKNDYYGKVKKEYGFRNYFYLEIKPIEDCLINININYENEMTQIPLNKEVIGVLNDLNYYGYFDFKPDLDEIVITITSLEKNREYDVYLKTNVINRDAITQNGIENKYSKPSSQNYDLKGKTNPLTSSISFLIKNIPSNMRNEAHVVRILINIEPFYKIIGQKFKIIVTPVINEITKIRPEQNMYYFSGIDQRNIEKAVFNLKNINKEDNLMIIEVSSCKGNFLYTLTDTPPLDTETYTQLQNKKIPSKIYDSNGKTIITVTNLEEKNYYLTLFGGNSDINTINQNVENKVDVLFYYYTTNEKKYNYLVTQDSLIYESQDNFYSLKITIPEIKKRDTLGKENNVDSMNYTLIVSDQKADFEYMESTCYLTKLDQKNQISKFENLKIEYDKNSNSFNIKGLEEGKTYYMNILGKNLNTGEVITYKPVVIVYSGIFTGAKIALIITLVIVLLLFLYMAFLIYRKYRLKKLQLNFVEENNNSGNSFDKKVGKKSNINLDFVKKKYNDLSEDNNEINDN